jgi:4-hydroxy-tetrahydrodipicolinate synthase
MTESGTYTVLVTPFIIKNGKNEIDYDSILKWMHVQFHFRIKNLVLHGTTSECPTVTENEKIEICIYVSRMNSAEFKDYFNIYVGIGGNCTQDCIDFANKIKKYCKGIMITVPYYSKPPQRGISAHFKTIANEFSELPVIMYNVPSRSAINMEPETMIDIINSCENVVALKEANGDLNHFKKFIELFKTTNRTLGVTFTVLSGDDINIVEHCKLGASGVISVASNIIPKQIKQIVELCLSQKFTEADIVLSQNKEFIKYLFVETNPIPIKEIMYLTNMYSTNILRLPLVSMETEKSKNLHNMYNQLAK